MDRDRDRHRAEDGVVTVLTTIAIFALLGVTALALDVGMLWVERRATSSQADSASLASIVELREGGGCSTANVQSLVETAVTADGGDPRDVTASVTCYPGAAKVAVEKLTEVDLGFAAVFGLSTSDVYARSVAEYGNVTTVTGLRPIALCVSTTAYQDYLHGRVPDPSELARSIFPMAPGTFAYRIDFTRQGTTGSDCNPGEDGAGNWGWLDFDSGGGGRTELADRLLNGYDGAVTADIDGWNPTPTAEDPNTGDCEPPAGADSGCPPQTGAGGNSVTGDLKTLLCAFGVDPYTQCETLWILIFDTITDGGGGNARFYPVGFAPVVLRDFHKTDGGASTNKFLDASKDDTDSGTNACLSAVPGTTPDAGWFCFEFLDLDAAGSMGPPTTGVPITRTSTVMHLCGAETTDLCVLP